MTSQATKAFSIEFKLKSPAFKAITIFKVKNDTMQTDYQVALKRRSDQYFHLARQGRRNKFCGQT